MVIGKVLSPSERYDYYEIINYILINITQTTNVKSALMYESETLHTTKSTLQKIQSFVNKFITRIIRMTRNN